MVFCLINICNLEDFILSSPLLYFHVEHDSSSVSSIDYEQELYGF